MEPVHASATTKSRQCSKCSWILTVVILGMAGWMLLDLEIMQEGDSGHTVKLSARKLGKPSSFSGMPSQLLAPIGTGSDVQIGSAVGQGQIKIYVYPLPQLWQVCESAEVFAHIRATIYGAEQAIPERLHNSSLLVLDPSVADFFYVPVMFYCHNDKTKDLAAKVVEHLRKKLPYWDRHQGRDHMFIFTRDHGYCGFANADGNSPPVLANSIILSHWGLVTSEIYCDWYTRLHNYGSCPMRRHPGLLPADRYYPPCHVPGKDIVVPVTVDNVRYTAAQHSRRGGERVRKVDSLLWYSACNPMCLVKEVKKLPEPPARGSALTFSFSYVQMIPEQEELTAQHLKQLQAALATTKLGPAAGDTIATAKVGERKDVKKALEVLTGSPLAPQFQPSIELAVARGKLYTMYFAGGSGYREDDTTYSHGVRQLVIALFRNQTGFKLVDRHKDGEQGANVYRDMSLSVFCLAATGAGWGVRLQQSIMMGCIPVVIGDGVEMPYEDVLPYKDFALRISQHAVYLLPSILEFVMAEPGRVEAMQQRLSCAWMYLSWTSEHGRALDSLACSLRRHKYGADNIFPTMDWDTCQLSCGGADTLAFDLDFRARDVNARLLDDVDQRMQYLDSKAGGPPGPPSLGTS